MDKPIKKDLAHGEGNRVAEGGSLLGEGNSPEDFAHVKRMTPLQTKMREIAADPQYQADAIDQQREQRSTRLRRDKDARAAEAGRHATPEQIEQEQRANNARVLPTLGAAAAAGPAMLAAETGVAELPGAAKGAAQMLGKLAAEHPLAAKVASAYGSWLAVHLAHKLGIPLPKILEAIAGE